MATQQGEPGQTPTLPGPQLSHLNYNQDGQDGVCGLPPGVTVFAFLFHPQDSTGGRVREKLRGPEPVSTCPAELGFPLPAPSSGHPWDWPPGAQGNFHVILGMSPASWPLP